jgi:hypothetical protein
MSADCFPEVRSPCSTGFWFPKSLESLLRLFLVYCNTKDKPLQTSAFPINLKKFLEFHECGNSELDRFGTATKGMSPFFDDVSDRKGFRNVVKKKL